jgi:hypothetical protein
LLTCSQVQPGRQTTSIFTNGRTHQIQVGGSVGPLTLDQVRDLCCLPACPPLLCLPALPLAKAGGSVRPLTHLGLDLVGGVVHKDGGGGVTGAHLPALTLHV